MTVPSAIEYILVTSGVEGREEEGEKRSSPNELKCLEHCAFCDVVFHECDIQIRTHPHSI